MQVQHPTGKVPGAQCSACPFRRRQLVNGFGASPSEAKVVFVGECPGYNEARKGLPFIGPSGQLIRALAMHAGFRLPSCQEAIEAYEGAEIDLGDVYFTNAALCLPSRQDASTYKTSDQKKKAALCCKGRLEQELKPYLEAGVPICALGGSSALALAGKDEITKMRGKWFADNTVLCTWHPAFILRSPHRVGELARDVDKLRHGKPRYLDHPNVDVILIDNPKKMRQLTDYLIDKCDDGTIPESTIAMDIESANIDWLHDQILSIQISWRLDSGAVITDDMVYTDVVRECLTRLFDRENGIKWVGHNFKFDMRFIRYQLGVENIWTAYDTLLADYVLDENKNHALKEVLTERFDLPDYEQDLVLKYLRSRNDDYSKVPREHLYEYGAMDTAYTLRLWYELRDELRDNGLFERPFQYPLMEAQKLYLDVELHGMMVDRERLQNLSDRLHTALGELHRRMIKMAGHDFNPNSYLQVGKIMYDEMGMPKFRARTKIGWSTAAKYRDLIMNQWRSEGRTPEGHPPMQWLEWYQQFKSMEKIRSSYVDNVFDHIDENGRVHPDVLLYGTETGRPSVRDPALQTIPRTGTGEAMGEVWGKAIKQCYAAPKGYQIVQVDYSQAELRTAAWLSRDPFLMDAYAQGADIHGAVAADWFPGWDEMTSEDTMSVPGIGDMLDKKTLRVQAKKGVFARLYLGTEHAIAGILGITSKEAKPYLVMLDKRLSGLVSWEQSQFRLMQKNGYVETLTGRRRRVPLITKNNYDDAKKAACNAPVQGTASDLTLISCMEVNDWLKDDEDWRNDETASAYMLANGYDWLSDCVSILITVHDSIILEVPCELVEYVSTCVKRIMENVGYRYMPEMVWIADIEVGPSWGDLK